MLIGSGVLLPGVTENPTFPILSALAYTTGLANAQRVISTEVNASRIVGAIRQSSK